MEAPTSKTYYVVYKDGVGYLAFNPRWRQGGTGQGDYWQRVFYFEDDEQFSEPLDAWSMAKAHGGDVYRILVNTCKLESARL